LTPCGAAYIEERSFDCVRAPARTAGKEEARANSAQDDGEGKGNGKSNGEGARLKSEAAATEATASRTMVLIAARRGGRKASPLKG
jgi:hypothetical protein